MDLTYNIGDTVTFFANFFDEFLEAQNIKSARVTVKHINELNQEVVDINEESMINIEGNEYYFKWIIPNSAFKGRYLVIYKAKIEGNDAEDVECFTIE